MSTLTTRIAGYRFTIITEADGRKTGAFMAEKDGRRVSFMDLPYELRSTYSQENGQTLPILAAACDAITTLNERTTYAAEYHVADCKCDNCTISLGMLDREYGILRGNQWLFFDREYAIKSNLMASPDYNNNPEDD